MAADNSPMGYNDAGSDNDPFNASDAMLDQIKSRIHTVKIVRIKAVRGGVGPVGTVDVEPLVNMADGQGKGVEHGIVYSLPYLRCQGGTSAVIMDPVVGDIGLAAFADRDTTNVKINKTKALPASRRMFSMSDGFYVGGTLNGTPVQFISFLDNKITITTNTEIVVNSPKMTVNCDDVEFVGASITHNGKHIDAGHEHTGVVKGGDVTGPPV